MLLTELPLTAGETDGTYVSQFTPGTKAFRVLMTGSDARGFAFQRMSAPLVAPKR